MLKQLTRQRDALRRKAIVCASVMLIFGIALVLDQYEALLSIVRCRDLFQKVAADIAEEKRSEADAPSCVKAIGCLAEGQSRNAVNFGLRQLEAPFGKHAESHLRGQLLIVDDQITDRLRGVRQSCGQF